MKIAVIMTCFNRREKTIKCLKELRKQLDSSNIEYDLHLTDDGCTDGTADAVLQVIPDTYIYKGSNLYWAGGMRLAWRAAYEKGGYDYFLFLNDDTYVNNNWIDDFKECVELTHEDTIIVCNVCDPITGKRTYAGDKIRKFPFKVTFLQPIGKPQYISYSGANLMFIPRKIVERVGFFPNIYIHGIADLDYCLRVQKYGFKVMMTSRFCGYCESDHGIPTNKDMGEMSLKERYLWLMSPKGKSAKQWIFFQYSFFPWRLPLVCSKILFQLLFGRKD